MSSVSDKQITNIYSDNKWIINREPSQIQIMSLSDSRYELAAISAKINLAFSQSHH